MNYCGELDVLSSVYVYVYAEYAPCEIKTWTLWSLVFQICTTSLEISPVSHLQETSVQEHSTSYVQVSVAYVVKEYTCVLW